MRSYLLIGIFAAITAFLQPAAAGICGCDDSNTQCIDNCGGELKACIIKCGITTVDCYTNCVQHIIPPEVNKVVSKVSNVIHAIPTVSAVLANPEGAISYAISEAVSSAKARSPFTPIVHVPSMATITPSASDKHDSNEDEGNDGEGCNDGEDEESYDGEEEKPYKDGDDDYGNDEDCDDDEGAFEEERDERKHEDDKHEDDKHEDHKHEDHKHEDVVVSTTTTHPTPIIVDAVKSAMVSTAFPSISSIVKDKISSAVHSERERIDEIIQRQREQFLNSVSSRLFAHPTPVIKVADVHPLSNDEHTSRDIDPVMFAAMDPSTLANNPEAVAALKAAGVPSDPETISIMMESGALPSDPAALSAMMESLGLSADPSAIAAIMGDDAAPTGTASTTGVEKDDDEECDGEDDDDDEVKPSTVPSAMSSGVPAASVNGDPASIPQASALPSDDPASAPNQQIRATVTAHTTVTSQVPSPSIGMLHGSGPSQSPHSSSGIKTEISSLLIAGVAVLFFNL